MTILSAALATIYIIALLFSFLYGTNSYLLLWLYRKRKEGENKENARIIHEFWQRPADADLPLVTIQLPLFNERYVAERLLRATCQIDYPTHRLEIQVLDDSTDDTTEILKRAVAELKEKGHHISLVHREVRRGFKAGALKEGLALASGELVAIFDADFVPAPQFLKETVPFFQDPKMALVQARWGHLNHDYSILTRAQALGIDGHFGVEQAARNWSGLFMNFNGTAGIWRKEAILDAGGWQADTLTEDLDLSYRALLKGWKMKYLPQLVCLAEVPVEMNAFKAQQHRWAKGSIQTARKLLGKVIAADLPLLVKYQAVLHLTHYLVHPMILLVALLSFPLLWLNFLFQDIFNLIGLAFLFFLSSFGPSCLYLFSQKILYTDWRRRARFMPFLLFLGTGIAVNNSKAVLEGLFRKGGEFARTPKFQVTTKRDDWKDKRYRASFNITTYLELALGFYSFLTIATFLYRGKYILSPFLVVFALGFFFVALTTFAQSGGNLRFALGRLAPVIHPPRKILAGEKARPKEVG